jgi:hypothetical protein
MKTLADEIGDVLKTARPSSRLWRQVRGEAAVAATLAGIRVDERLGQPAPIYQHDESPEATATRLAATHAAWLRGEGVSLPRILADGFASRGIAPGSPLRAGALLAAVLVSAPSSLAYHTLAHTREVVINAAWLLAATADLAAQDRPGAVPISRDDTGTLLLAAAMHDLGHDGGRGVRGGADEPPHRLEERAFRWMRPGLRRLGVSAAILEDLHTILLITDPVLRPDARRVTDHVLFGTPYPAKAAHHPVLSPIIGRPSLAQLCALMADADVLSSVGLTVAWQDEQTRRLGEERGAPISRHERLHFQDRIAGPGLASAAGRLLDQNWHVIRATVAGTVSDK